MKMEFSTYKELQAHAKKTGQRLIVTYESVAEKNARNKPCRCGSGKKTKACCGE